MNTPAPPTPATADADPNRPVAVALSYDGGEAAPRVVAKGYGQQADQFARFMHMQAVFAGGAHDGVGQLMQVDLDAHIPPQLYTAVAELLAWLYRLEARELPEALAPRA